MRFMTPLLLLSAFASVGHAQVFRRNTGGDATASGRIIWNGKDYTNTSLNGYGRYCSNPQCAMCNRLFGPMPGYELTASYGSRRVASPVTQGTSPVVSSQTVLTPVTLPETLPANFENAVTAFDPSPPEVGELMMMLAQVGPGDVVYDPGCGDGRLLHAAVKRGATAVGVEINPETFERANELAEPYGDSITIHLGDLKLFSPTGVTVVAMYLFPPVIEQLMPMLNEAPSGTRVISYAHDLPGVDAERYKLGDQEFYLWTVP